MADYKVSCIVNRNIYFVFNSTALWAILFCWLVSLHTLILASNLSTHTNININPYTACISCTRLS